MLFQWKRAPKIPAWGFDALAVLILLLFGFNTALPYDRFHYNFYLGAINDVLGGKSMFVDGAIQYGMWITYVLALPFTTSAMTLSYASFSFLIGVIVFTLLIMLYVLLRISRVHPALAVLAMWLMVITHIVRAHASSYTHPSAGPMRYGLIYLLVFWIGLKYQFPQRKRLLQILIFATIALASGWSFETLGFTWVTYAGIVLLEVIAQAPSWRSGIRQYLTQIAIMVTVGIGSVAAFHVYTYWRSGFPPNWDIYLEFFRLYSGFSWIVDLWSPWLVVFGLLYGSLSILLFKLLLSDDRRNLLRYVIILGVTMVGIVQIYYWIRVPFTRTLGQYMLPPIFVLIFWLNELLQQPGRMLLKRASVVAVAVGTIAITLTAFLTPLPPTPISTPAFDIAQALREGRFPTLNLSWRNTPSMTTYLEYESPYLIDTQLNELVALINQYAPHEPRLVVLVPPETATSALVQTGKVNVYPTSDPILEDIYNPVGLAFVLAYQPDLEPGTVIFVQADEENLLGMQLHQLNDLRERYTFEWLDISPSNIAVVRLGEQGGDA